MSEDNSNKGTPKKRLKRTIKEDNEEVYVGEKSIKQLKDEIRKLEA